MGKEVYMFNFIFHVKQKKKKIENNDKSGQERYLLESQNLWNINFLA